MTEKWMAKMPSAASWSKLSHVSPEKWSTGLTYVCSIFCKHSFSFFFLEKITYCSIYIVMWDFTSINTWFYGVQFILHLQFSFFFFLLFTLYISPALYYHSHLILSLYFPAILMSVACVPSAELFTDTYLQFVPTLKNTWSYTSPTPYVFME